MNVLKNLLLFLPKLMLKAVLNIIGLVLSLIGLFFRLLAIVSAFAANLLGGFCGFISAAVLLFVLINHCWDEFKALVLGGFGLTICFFILPYISSAASEFIGNLGGIIKEFADFPLIRDYDSEPIYKTYTDTEDYDNSNNDESSFNSDDSYNSNNSYYEEKQSVYEPKAEEPKREFDFFAGVKTRDELKKRYFALAKCYHPDSSGADTNEQMEYINSEYQRLLNEFKDN